MSWTDTQSNCFFEVCCGKDGKQLRATVEVLEAEAHLSRHKAVSAAAWLVGNRDFAPKGTLYGLKVPVTVDDLHREAGLDKPDAAAVVAFVDSVADCAPKGALYAFKQEVGRLARGEAYE